jgi:lipoate-protein ligase A
VPIPADFDLTGWDLTATQGEAGPFHARAVPEHPAPSLWVHRVHRPALVLGSTQSAELVDPAAAERRGVELARRRSGGGLVLVHPDHSRWVDVVIPRDHPRWHDDVGRAFDWLGRAWSDAIAAVLPAARAGSVRHHEGGLVRNRWSPVLCFAGLGPGEVTIDGSKVVGMSQRRTRGWARFQCLVLTEADPDLLAELVVPAALPGPAAELRDLPIGHPLDLDAVLDAFLGGLGGGERRAHDRGPK